MTCTIEIPDPVAHALEWDAPPSSRDIIEMLLLERYREGKVTRLNRWLEETGHSLEDSYFYSDSMNDLPLLEQVDHPVAVDPDPNLRAEAIKRGWEVISLRD